MGREDTGQNPNDGEVRDRQSIDEVLAEVERLRTEVADLRDRAVADDRDPAPITLGSRRQLLRLAGASAVGVVAATAGGRSVAAADPNDVVRNKSNLVTDTTTLDGTFTGPTLSLFNRSAQSPSSGLYASSDSPNPTVRADNSATGGVGGVGVAGNAPGGRDLLATGSGRIAMTDHAYGNAGAYAAGEIHQSGGSLYALVSPTVRREIVGPATTGALHPLTPTRVYDSRQPVPQFGRLGPGQERVISVADGRDTETGAVTVSGLVPPGATAIMFNVTVDRTDGPGYLFVAPASTTGVTASTINWTTSGTTIGNSSMVGLSGDRLIRVYCSPSSSTEFIIDVLGYYA